MREIALKAFKLTEIIKKQNEVLIVTHIDADGITAGAIALKTLEMAGIDARIRFVKQLDVREVEALKDENKFVWFTDLGSGQIDILQGLDYVITDHHKPKAKSDRQLNPHDFNLDGSIHMSGSIATLLIANKIYPSAKLANLAIVGAVGDLQDSRFGKLVGVNRAIVEKLRGKFLDVTKDLRIFGKQTRPIAKMLEYCTDPFLVGLTGNEAACVKFLSNLKVDPWARWIEIGREEQKRVASSLIKRCMDYGLSYEEILRLGGESYILLNQEEGTEKRDAMEFSTLLNATARYDEADIGLRVCFDDEDAFRRARTLLQNHRKNLSSGLRLVDEIGIVELENIQYFHAGKDIKDTIVGIVAGMSLYKVNPKKPIVAFAESDEGIKVSARASYKLVEKGLDLSAALSLSAKAVGGYGGGHSVAAGALIPKGSEEEFLKILDSLIGQQLKHF